MTKEVTGPSPVQSTSVAKLSIIPIGEIKRQPKGVSADNETLHVHELRSWIELLYRQTDLIVFDCGSLLLDTNAIHLATLSDVTLLTVDAQRSKATKVQAAEKVLRDLGITYATILNRANRDSVE